MTAWFWFAAAALLVLGLAVLLPPLLRARPRAAALSSAGVSLAVLRDQAREARADLAAGLISTERFAELNTELEQRTLEDTAAAAQPAAAAAPARRTALFLALALPLCSVLTYLALGQPGALQPPSAAAPSEQEQAAMAGQMEQAMAQLAAKLKAQPGNAEGWRMLGRSHAVMGQHEQAAAAYRQAATLLPQDAGVLADLADSLAMVQGAKLSGEPTRLIQQALALDPQHAKALALAGSAAFEAGAFAQARAHWERLLPLVPADSETAQALRGSIAQARSKESPQAAEIRRPPPEGVEQSGRATFAQESGAPSATAAPAAATPATPATEATPATAAAVASVAGSVSLAPALAAKVKPGDTLFIFARAAEGPRMPLAILKHQASELPLSFKLNDSMAMQPQMKLSAFASVVLTARISSSGGATPQSGDLVGQSAAVVPGAQGVHIVIDQILP